MNGTTTPLGNGSGLPARNSAYHPRPRLEGRLQLTAQRLTVLRAPCGFGKTALLANACHAERDRGTTVFWLTCAGESGGETLTRDLAGVMRGCAHAVCKPRGGKRIPPTPVEGLCPAPPSGTRLGAASRRFVLVLDDAELLRSADSVAMIDSLLRHGPPGLHIAVAMRATPPGLDIATPIIDGRGSLLTGEELRFTDAEIAGFLGCGRQRRELASVARTTQGWPLAVGIARSLACNADLDELSLAQYRGQLDDHLHSRLVRGLSGAQRDYLASLAMCDAIDPEILTAVLGDDHLRHWEGVSSVLGELIRPVDSNGGLQLHPLAREVLCARLGSADIDRIHRTHGRFAEAISQRRGPTADAVAHAVLAADPALCEGIIRRHGGLGILLTEGMAPFLDICRHLTEEVVHRAPGLVPLRAAALLFQDRLDECGELLGRHAGRAGKALADSAPGDDRMAGVEFDMVEWMWHSFACKSVDDWEIARLISSVTRYADADWLPSVNRGAMCMILMAKDIQFARFEAGRRRGALARRHFSLVGAGFGLALVDVHEGVAAMVQGRVGEAASAIARSNLGAAADTLALELRLEQGGRGPRTLPNPSPETTPWVECWFEIQASDHGNRAELAFERDGPQAAVEALSESFDRVRRKDLPKLQRLVDAQRVFWLVRAGDPAAAERVWIEADMPCSVVQIVDLSHQSWREFESVACARIALLAARGEVDAARRLAAAIAATARGWGLKRPLMRCLAVWSALEHRASNPDAAAVRLAEFLSLYRNTDYARPLEREGDAPFEILEDLLAREGEPDTRTDALTLLARLRGDPSVDGSERFTGKEIEVLNGLAQGLRNKEIARSLGISDSGVRYHLKAIYRTLDTNNRVDAVRRAGELGIALNP